MRPALVASVAEPPRLLAEWDELAERMGASPFLRPGWVNSWSEAYGKGRLELRIVRAPDGRLAALLPVQRELGALASPTNWHSPEFGWLAESEAARDVLLAALFTQRPRRVSLGFLDSAAADALGAATAQQGYRVLRRTLQRSPTLPIDGDFPAYERRLGKNLRGDLGRRRRLLTARGRVSFEVSAGEPLDELLAQGFAVEGSGWKDERGTAIRSHAVSRRFYTEVARWAAARGWLRLGFLRLDGRVLAFDFCLEVAGIHYMLKTGYDQEFRALSPGKLIRHAMIERAFRTGLRSYELLGGEEPWKLQWTPTTRARELVQGFSPSPLGQLDWSLFAYGRPLVKRARDLARGHARRTAARAEAGGTTGVLPPRAPGEA